MSDPIRHLDILNNNPFIFAPAIFEFFKALGKREHSLLLAYLVLPISLPVKRRLYLKRDLDASNLRTMAERKDLLHGLQDSIGDYKGVTNATLQYLASSGCIEILRDEVIVRGALVGLDAPSPPGLEKATVTLARFFNEYDVPTIFRMVGVLSL
ncbi:hypothetical protein GJ699_00315 [Duganella sp. FT80W]|uniref:Uncharacterized protein n=1 Tax=Duganella guangzhouensis TaxID=2666084 RepID=A0A6I2KTR3_9BURK|nr:three component ABC system middle component [Duganella guangzhouensis]MRW88427.1 hypothetical protein [Duganella guangzhouensis]